MKKFAFVLVALASANAFGKISIFSNADALVHVLQSPELRALRELHSLELTSAGVQAKGPQGIGTTYDVGLRYANTRGGVPTTCQLTARVVNEEVRHGGITASRLSRPAVSQVRCAH